MELSFRMNEAGLSKMGTDWLRQLKERLNSGGMADHTPEGEPGGCPDSGVCGADRRVSLVYQQPGEDQYFQIFLNPDGTKADAIWSSTESREPELYTEDEMSAIEQHIQNTFGDFENVFHELCSRTSMWDICVVPPSEERGLHFTTLVTMGMGAHRMHVPEELAGIQAGAGGAGDCPAAGLETGWGIHGGGTVVLAHWPLESAGPPANCQRYLAGVGAHDGQAIALLQRARSSAPPFSLVPRARRRAARSALCPAARRSTSIR